MQFMFTFSSYSARLMTNLLKGQRLGFQGNTSSQTLSDWKDLTLIKPVLAKNSMLAVDETHLQEHCLPHPLLISETLHLSLNISRNLWIRSRFSFYFLLWLLLLSTFLYNLKFRMCNRILVTSLCLLALLSAVEAQWGWGQQRGYYGNYYGMLPKLILSYHEHVLIRIFRLLVPVFRKPTELRRLRIWRWWLLWKFRMRWLRQTARIRPRVWSRVWSRFWPLVQPRLWKIRIAASVQRPCRNHILFNCEVYSTPTGVTTCLQQYR